MRVFTLLLVFLPAMALAHGDAAWIQHNPAYLMRIANTHCCDESHCHRVPADFVRRTAEGWIVRSTGQVFLDGRQGLYQSVDDDWWACGADDNVWCLFIAPAKA